MEPTPESGSRAPSRDEVLEHLDALIAGRQTREDASAWAERFLDFEGFIEPSVWKGVTALMGADLKDSPSTYLHDLDDFMAWRDRLTNTDPSKP